MFEEEEKVVGPLVVGSDAAGYFLLKSCVFYPQLMIVHNSSTSK